jgi:hypothetical protein
MARDRRQSGFGRAECLTTSNPNPNLARRKITIFADEILELASASAIALTVTDL